jgi:phosphonate transport system substrate-binding protein
MICRAVHAASGGGRGRFWGVADMLGRLVASLLFSGVMATAAHAQTNELVFAVTEGVTYQATPKEIRDKFAPIADVFARATGKRVRTVLVPAYNDVRAGLAKQEYDIAFIHPAHVSMAEIKAGRYKSVAWTTGFTEYTVSMLMPAAATLNSMEEMKGRTLVTPDPDSITAVMVRAMLRTEKISWTADRDPPPATVKVITTRYQDAVPFYLENGFAQVAATAANSVVKGWTDKGGKILAKSKSVPIKQFIVSTRMPADEQQRIRDALLGLKDAKGGKEVLDIVGYRGFLAPNPETETAAIAWLGL